ncbi:MAG: type I-E CRISPR-associated protein Cse1/CasA [Candidatus Sumerlaeaceae bacterium]|nr:type I-E CRISPR-associated protein Cse1/CasA [Candidatus Sumerlaeaceae bacterium]
MTNANYQFSLVKDPWLPVLFNNGTQDRLTLLEVFDCAEEIRSVAAPNPLDRFALLRFLAIVAAWSCPSQTLPRWQEICSGVPSFLEQHMQCFNLFGDGPRFYQDAAAKNKNDTVGKLFHEIPTGTNIAHFMHVTDEGGYGICPGCCTVALLRLPVFSTVGGKGYSPSPRPTGTYAFAHTECLAEAISWGASRILQIASTTNTPLGDPVWSSNPQPSGFLEKLTMSPRWVWLHDPSSNIKPCLMCGNSSQLITPVGYVPAP